VAALVTAFCIWGNHCLAQSEDDLKASTGLAIRSISVLPLEAEDHPLLVNVAYENLSDLPFTIQADGKVMISNFTGSFWKVTPQEQLETQDMIWSMYLDQHQYREGILDSGAV
jgi:hypothetical protein